MFLVTVKQIHAVLYALAPFSYEVGLESPEARFDRYLAPAQAITHISNTSTRGAPQWIAAGLITIFEQETHGARYVGLGQCSNPPPGAELWNCDGGRSRTYFQLQRTTCPLAWLQPQGSRQELFAATRCAANQFSGAYRQCRGRHPQGALAGAFSGYRHRIICTWSGHSVNARVASFTRHQAKLWQRCAGSECK